MLNQLAVRAVRWVWGKFDGKKTIAGIIMKGSAYLLGTLRIIFPDIQVSIPTDVDTALNDWGELFIYGGVAHKIDKGVKK